MLSIHEAIKQDVLSLKSCRIIFNLGAGSTVLMQYYQRYSIETMEACTLVMLRFDQFEWSHCAGNSWRVFPLR